MKLIAAGVTVAVGHHEIALTLAVIVVHDYDHGSGFEFINGRLNFCKSLFALHPGSHSFFRILFLEHTERMPHPDFLDLHVGLHLRARSNLAWHAFDNFDARRGEREMFRRIVGK